MGHLSKAIFLSTPAADAYRTWLSFMNISEPAGPSGLDKLPDRAVCWSRRWAVTQIDGHAEFIPAEGGCVMYLTFSGAGSLSRVLLWFLRPVQRYLWRSVDRFRSIAERSPEPEAVVGRIASPPASLAS